MTGTATTTAEHTVHRTPLGDLGRNPLSILIPCHRIVGSTGKLAGYAGGLKCKRFLLDLEQAHAGHTRAYGEPGGLPGAAGWPLPAW
jgi:O-6-methylguanine DNA methyltransferase